MLEHIYHSALWLNKKKVTYGLVEEEKEYFCTSVKHVETVSDIVPVVP